MQFENFAYERPDMESFTRQFEDLLEQFGQALNVETQNHLLSAINEMRTEFNTRYNLCHIRHTIDTRDAFYEAENEFFDREMPHFQALNHRFYEKLVGSPFRHELEMKWGKQVFRIAELSLRTFHPDILEDLQEENRLSSEYVKLKALAEIGFQGQTYNLSSIRKLEVAPDRAVRKGAKEAESRFYETHAAQIDELFDRLVKTRHRMARKLGYSNFISLGYARMLRSDYTPDMVAVFRRQIEEQIVPLAGEIYERQRRRLGVDRLTYYDEEYRFASGNPQPQGDPAWIVENAARMYEALSPETHAFFDFMRGNNLLDLEAKTGKATGGYCTYIGKYQAPFIFSNFNGTSGDIEVLTHEAGHAFQVYSSRHFPLNEYHWPTYEACEIHSMGMEFFTWPWMNLFFLDQTEKFRFAHLSNAIGFLPYGAAVDEFQHVVYSNPDATPQDRHEAWRALEQKYLPHRNYEGNTFLQKGTYWLRQTHIFAAPFYYIDYVLAQICAFQLWKKDQEDHAAAWADYLRLCRAGGSLSFLELVELGNLRSPFEEGCVESVVDVLKTALEKIKDEAF